MIYANSLKVPVFKSHFKNAHHHISRPRHFMYLVFGLVSFLLILGLIGGTVWYSLQQSQDIRQKAAGNATDQKVEVTAILAGNRTNLIPNQDNEVTLRVNTHGENTYGVQLFFCIQSFSGTVVSVNNVNTQLTGTPTVTQNADGCNGWSIRFIGFNISGFNTLENTVDVLKVAVRPTSYGSVVFSFNDTLSKSMIVGQEDVDSLKTIPPQTFTCPPPELTATPTTVVPPTATPTRTANCNCSGWQLVNPAVPADNICDVNSNRPYRCGRSCPAGCTAETVACLSATDCGVTPPTSTPTATVAPGGNPSATPTPTRVTTAGTHPTATPTRYRTPTPTGTKNWSEIAANCNKSCTTNSNCPNNMRCYGNQCRLADNPTASNCGYPADQGIARKCNEYCSDSNECGDGLTCWFNRCRAPEAVDHTDCSLPNSVVARSMQLSCNKTCVGNKDCSVNMRCYNGQCRSASNPTSATCAPATRRVAAAPLSTGTNKGDVINTTTAPEPTLTLQPDDQTDRYTADTGSLATTPTITADTYGQVGQKDDDTTSTIDTPMAPVYKLPSWSNPELPWDQRLAALLQSRQAWLPLAVFGVGGILLVIALLAGRRKKVKIPEVKITEHTVPPAQPTNTNS